MTRAKLQLLHCVYNLGCARASAKAWENRHNGCSLFILAESSPHDKEFAEMYTNYCIELPTEPYAQIVHIRLLSMQRDILLDPSGLEYPASLRHSVAAASNVYAS